MAMLPSFLILQYLHTYVVFCIVKGLPLDGSRLHVTVRGRYVTIFRQRGVLSAIDSICYHAGGPLTKGPLQDIEELGMTVVMCPWHNYPVSIDKGVKGM